MKANIRLLLEKYQVRQTYDEKTLFIEWMSEKCNELGYEVHIDEKKKCRNLIVGDVKDLKIILTAHYDTPKDLFFPIYIFVSNIPMFIISNLLPVIPYLSILSIGSLIKGVIKNDTIQFFFVLSTIIFLFLVLKSRPNKNNANDNTSGVGTLLSIMEELPVEQRDKVCFVFFDLEENGLVGSNIFKSKYSSLLIEKQLINFDCVGNGKTFLFVSKKKFRNSEFYTSIKDQSKMMKNKSEFRSALTNPYMSDQLHFKNSCGVLAANHIRGLGYYLDRIHTKRDTVFQNENIEDLTNMMKNYITIL